MYTPSTAAAQAPNVVCVHRCVGNIQGQCSAYIGRLEHAPVRLFKTAYTCVCMVQAAYGSDVPARRQRQQQSQYAGNGSGAYPNGGYPSHYAGSQRAAQGVAYDERTGQFVVNGRPYGAYR